MVDAALDSGGGHDSGSGIDASLETDRGTPAEVGDAAVDEPDAGPADGGADTAEVTDAGGDAETGASCAPAPTSPIVVNVRDLGATGDGATNDTAAIQAAVDQVAGTGGTVLVPDGTYLVDALARINLRSSLTFRMADGAVLRALPNGAESYDIIRIASAMDVNVIGGTLVGERGSHTGSTGEWGMCLGVYESARVVIERVSVRDCWGDGFYVGSSTTDARFCTVVSDNNRRQAMSITSVDGLVIQDSVFKNTSGTAPQCGIDIEPNSGETVANVQILRSQFLDNAASGIEVILIAPSSTIRGVTIDHNTITGNHIGVGVWTASGVIITNNTIVDGWIGISMGNGSTGNTVTGNTISAPNPIDGGAGSTIQDNTIL